MTQSYKEYTVWKNYETPVVALIYPPKRKKPDPQTLKGLQTGELLKIADTYYIQFGNMKDRPLVWSNKEGAEAVAKLIPNAYVETN